MVVMIFSTTLSTIDQLESNNVQGVEWDTKTIFIDR